MGEALAGEVEEGLGEDGDAEGVVLAVAVLLGDVLEEGLDLLLGHLLLDGGHHLHGQDRGGVALCKRSHFSAK